MDGVSYPDAPWELRASLWLTLFTLGEDADALHPRGLWGAAFVSYVEPSPLTYSELLVARLVRDPGARRASSLRPAGWRGTITDIWVDSPASLAGGRALWAIPKGLADFAHTGERPDGAGARWEARADRLPIASASYAEVPGVGRAAGRLPRAPFSLGLWQPGLPDTGGAERTVSFRGRARMVPQRARWTIDADSPLAFLRRGRAWASVRLADADLRFG